MVSKILASQVKQIEVRECVRRPERAYEVVAYGGLSFAGERSRVPSFGKEVDRDLSFASQEK